MKIIDIETGCLANHVGLGTVLRELHFDSGDKLFKEFFLHKKHLWPIKNFLKFSEFHFKIIHKSVVNLFKNTSVNIFKYLANTIYSIEVYFLSTFRDVVFC